MKSRTAIPDPVQYLKDDHARIATLISEVEKTREGDIERRRECFEKLREALVAHANAEEYALYPALAEKKETAELAAEAVEEHRLVSELLEQLGGMLLDTKEWSYKFKVLAGSVANHVEEEENEIFPKFEELLAPAEVDAVAEHMEKLMSTTEA